VRRQRLVSGWARRGGRLVDQVSRTAGQQPRLAPTTEQNFRPTFHPLPLNTEALAAGAYAVEWSTGGEATLIDQHTGQSRTVTYGDGQCGPTFLTPLWLGWYCDGASTASSALVSLYSGQTISLPVGTPEAAGRNWLQYDVPQDLENATHSPTIREFTNIATGQLMSDPAIVGGSIYPDLNRLVLAQRACSPVSVPGFYDRAGESEEPGSLAFFGRTAVEADPAGGGLLRIEHCGSAKILRINTPAGVDKDHARNPQIFVWAEQTSIHTWRVEGIAPRTERRFSIVMPAQVDQDAIESIALNDTTLYVTAAAADPVTYQATLPTALQSP
jgi:hypothetical protein